jgi:hypothetical protein
MRFFGLFCSVLEFGPVPTSPTPLLQGAPDSHVFSFWALPRIQTFWPPRLSLYYSFFIFRSDVIHVQIRGYRICSIGYRLSRYRNHPSRSNARQLRRPRGACRVPCVPCGAEFVSCAVSPLSALYPSPPHSARYLCSAPLEAPNKARRGWSGRMHTRSRAAPTTIRQRHRS